MKLEGSTNQFITNTQGYKYKVATTPHMMKLLSDNIYSDKISAVIRELSTNAVDAHIAANNPEPFEVHLPTYTNNTFTIRDFGTGLSKEYMEELYTTYGESNRQDSNEFTGCMGLGSKSPYCYVNTFTSISYYNGMKYIYVNSKDENNCPILNFLGEEDTNEPNGLEVSFQCKKDDRYYFDAKAKRIFSFFKLKPKIVGGLNIPEHNYVLRSDNYGLVDYNYDTNILAVMGNVAYPVITTNKWFDRLQIHIFFNIGEIDVDVARENLQYNSKTVRAIDTKLTLVQDEISKQIQQEIDKCSNLYDARCKHRELTSCLNKKFDVEYKGIIISGSLDIKSSDENHVLKLSRNKTIRCRSLHFPCKFYKKDVKVGYVAALKHLTGENYLINYADPEEYKNLLFLIGIQDKDVLPISSVKYPKDSYSYIPSVLHITSNRRISCELDIDGGGIFCVKRYTHLIHFDRPGIYITNIHTLMSEFGLDVYAVPLQLAKRLSKNKKWKTLNDAIREKFDEKVKLENPFIAPNTKSQLGYKYDILLRFYHNTTLKEHDLYKFADKIVNYNTHLTPIKTYGAIKSPLLDVVNMEMIEEVNKMYERYPFLQLVNSEFDVNVFDKVLLQMDSLCNM